jgi:hypothetical protein
VIERLVPTDGLISFDTGNVEIPDATTGGQIEQEGAKKIRYKLVQSRAANRHHESW